MCIRDRHNRGRRPTILTVDSEDSKERWIWKKHPDSFSPQEKRKLLGKVVEILVKVTFENHFYKWNNNIYRQTRGGPIGLRAAQSLARIIMDFWLQECKQKLMSGGIVTKLLDKYVDDVLAVLESLPLGSRWVEGRVEYLQEWEQIDRDLGRTKEEVTMAALLACANSILPFVQFTGVLSKGESCPVPCLDTQIWWGRSGDSKLWFTPCLLYTSPSPRDKRQSRMPSSA